ncbi:MerR family transcriptional regulator [Thermomonospora catenispora]|uniref:MerR family transcriptional regulator n=1 Tax=Thermomonospora catenispora TaxID=2493090 RepID=UPI001124A870|nr:MerR family transcriptional regulator [Thermomonospora catenispora]TNY36694.1 MerR family transcriptional regulator [Thermomonospora catenispora]
MSIGELAGRFGLRPHVLRHWEAMGLLSPARGVGGRRRYTEDHVTRVAMIVRGKAAGFSLERLREMFQTPDPRRRRDLLRAHYAALERRIEEIKDSQRLIEHALECRSEDFTRCPEFRRLVEGLAAGRGATAVSGH